MSIIIGASTVNRDRLKGVDRKKGHTIELARRAIHRMPLIEALEKEWTDADVHLTQYYVEGDEWSTFPRINDGGICEFTERGIAVWVTCFFLDIDSEVGKCDVPWDTGDEGAVRAAIARYRALMPDAGFYSTSGGLRAVQPLSRALTWEEARTYAKAWRAELKRSGVVFDEKSTCEPGRFMRAPHVNRTDKKTGRGQGFRRAMVCEWEGMTPILPTPLPVQEAVDQPVEGRRVRRLRVEAQRAERDTDISVERWGQLTTRVAKAVRDRPVGTGHSVYLALAGALLETGVCGPDDVVGFVVEVAEKAGEPKAEDRRKGAVNTAQRWMADEHNAGMDALREYPGIVAAIEYCMRVVAGRVAQATALGEAEERLADFVRETDDWVRVAAADCGVGKTQAAKHVAKDNAMRALQARAEGRKRDPLGCKTLFLVPTTALAQEFFAWFQAEGVPVQRWFGPLSYRGEGECQKREKALPVVQSGQSMRKVLCGTCEFRKECKAFEGFEGDEHPLVVIAPHAMAGKALEWAGKTGLVVFDEPNAPVESVRVTAEDWDIFRRNMGIFGQKFATVMRGVVEEMDERDYGSTWTPVPLRRLRADGPADAGAVDASYARGGPPWRKGLWAQIEGGWITASAVYTATRVARLVWDLLRSRATAEEEAVPERVAGLTPRMKLEEGGDWVFQRWNGPWATVVGRMHRVCVLDAGAEIYAAEYERFLGGRAPDVYVARVGDANEVEREVLGVKATRRGWFGEDGSVTDTKGVTEALRGVVRWAKAKRVKRVGLFTWKRVREAWEGAGESASGDVRSLSMSIIEMVKSEGGLGGVEYVTGNYGATRGSNRWMDCDALVTVGDPRPNIGAIGESLEFAGVEAMVSVEQRAEALAREELNQAHGRLRTVRRGRKAWALHVGRLIPGGTGWETGDVAAVA